LQAFNFSGVSASELHVWRGERHVLRGVSFEAAGGALVHVAGPNGSGKTTLLLVLAGLLPAEQGEVRWRNAPIAAQRDEWSVTIAYLGHSDALKSELTARENLAFDAGMRRPVAPAEIDEALTRVGLSASRDLPARALSAGQRRRLAMARVMLSGAPLWLLDEPFTNLDHVGTVLLSGVIALHLDAGGTALIAAHQRPAIGQHTAISVELGS